MIPNLLTISSRMITRKGINYEVTRENTDKILTMLSNSTISF